MSHTFSILGLLLTILSLLPAAGTPRQSKAPFADLQAAADQPLNAKDAKAVVLFFLLADCPASNYYTTEISAIVKQHTQDPVRFFVVHTDPDLTAADIAKHAQTWKLTSPILHDTRHKLVKSTGVTVTPEVAVILPDGTLAYRGRIDDIYVELGKRRAEPSKRDLRDALAAVLKGQPVAEPRTKAIGCFIPDSR
jgi:hypothetical protein